MTLQDFFEILTGNPVESMAVAAVLGLVTVKKLELPVWKWLAEWGRKKADSLGRCINASLNAEVTGLRGDVQSLREQLSSHIIDADKREADGWRASILHFNVEIMDGRHLTREDYIEILAIIDAYEAYCRSHEDYKNNRAVAAVRNIKRRYDEKMTSGFKEDT